MNEVFRHELKVFVLVFFDDILVYSPNADSHYTHLKRVLGLLRANSIFAKMSKCSFGQSQVEYLGHVINEKGVGVDPSKIQSVMDWPQPQTVKALRGFLGLTGYYRKFVKNYGLIAKPLTALLKKGGFKWNEEANEAFSLLKAAMTQTPVLQLPDFSKPFILETDASYNGIGAVLMQDKHPLAYLSKALGPKSVGLSVYEKEFLAIILAVQKWRAYLICGTFIIRTDQNSLKYLLEQKITTPLQHKYMAKLMGYNYTIEYKKGAENGVADALSRREEEATVAHINIIQPMWITEVIGSYEGDSWAQEAIAECTVRPLDVSFFHYESGLLKFKGRVYVGSTSDLRSKILTYIHQSNMGGHSGIQGTYQRVQLTFLWPGMRQSKGKEVIWVVVDRFTKYSHFIALAHPISASSLAQVFIEEIYRLHGLPTYIVSDRDTIFTSLFWKELMQ